MYIGKWQKTTFLRVCICFSMIGEVLSLKHRLWCSTPTVIFLSLLSCAIASMQCEMVVAKTPTIILNIGVSISYSVHNNIGVFIFSRCFDDNHFIWLLIFSTFKIELIKIVRLKIKSAILKLVFAKFFIEFGIKHGAQTQSHQACAQFKQNIWSAQWTQQQHLAIRKIKTNNIKWNFGISR